MNIEELREYCLSKPGTSEGLPFGPDTLVFKVLDKMFALTGLDSPELAVNLKCAPELAIKLREQYPCVRPGYHMSKKHWNTVDINGSVDDSQLHEWINHSYDLVVSKLPKKQQESLKL
jgi:predicted DNA-binding protein (MmcQ/YjbR family)